MRIDLTGSEFVSLEADVCPGEISVLARAVPDVAQGALQVRDAPTAYVTVQDVVHLRPMTIREGLLQVHLPWSGVFLVDTAEPLSTQTFERRVLMADVHGTLTDDGRTAQWTLTFSITFPVIANALSMVVLLPPRRKRK